MKPFNLALTLIRVSDANILRTMLVVFPVPLLPITKALLGVLITSLSWFESLILNSGAFCSMSIITPADLKSAKKFN